MNVSVRLDIMTMNPPGFAHASVAIAGARAGYAGMLCLEHCEIGDARRVIDQAVAAGVSFGVTVEHDDQVAEVAVRDAVGRGLKRVLLCNPVRAKLEHDVASWRSTGVDVLVEVRSLEDALLAQRCGADAIVVKGSEAGGRISEETSFILLQRVSQRVTIPIWVRGGIGIHTAAACLAAGAVGVVLDWQLALCVESELPPDVRQRVARMDGSETAVLGGDGLERYRAYVRPGEKAFATLNELQHARSPASPSQESRDSAWREAVEKRIRGAGEVERLLLIGQDAAFASPLAKEYSTVKGIADALRRSAATHCRLASEDRVLRPGGPLAESHGTRYPIVQGPMTRVSDTADFADAVAKGGGLPFLALALLRGPQVATLLEETKRRLGARPWGVGILGFVPRELREEQLAEVRKYPPPYAIIAGGRPDQSAALEREGIRSYLHVPSPALLKMFLEQGATRVIFEGRECGGHVGPRTSFVLWNSMIRVMLEHLSSSGANGGDLHVLFAGGIHDALSASMVAAMAAPLSARGVRVGVLLGTSYLFTEEAVASGAVVKEFQNQAVACDGTILLETGVGHATRCADTSFGRQFAEEKRRLIQEGRSADEIRLALETLNLGRLRIASKGITRDEDFATGKGTSKFREVETEAQRRDGLYMIGQVAALRDRVLTIEDLHKEVSQGGVDRLLAFSPSVVSLRDTRGPSDVAIVGMSCLFPKAGDLQQFWSNIVNGVNGITEVPADRWDWKLYFDGDRTARDKIYSKWGGFLDDVAFDPTIFGMPPNTMPSIEPLHLLVLEAVRHALDDSGYGDRPFDRQRTSVVLGAGGGVADLGLGYGFRALLPYFLTQAGGTADEAYAIIEKLADSLPEWTEDSFAGLLMNVAAGRIANRFDLGGTNYAVDAACASSLAALRLGVNELETGSSDMVIVGGADTMLSPFAYLCFSKTQALSPTGRCRTFDESADGIVISEGIAFAVLKRLADAQRDGDRIYSVIKSVGASSDGKDKGLTAPRPAGQMRALERAYAKAGVDPSTVGLIEAHGTGTVAGDQSEVESLTKTFSESGSAVQSCALGSVKSMIGHTKCAAGIAGLLKASLALHHKVLPPTIGVEHPNPKANFEKSPFYVNTEARPWIKPQDGSPRRAGVSAFGFGGTNFHAVVEEYLPNGDVCGDTPVSRTRPAELLLWRADSGTSIAKLAKALATALDGGASPALVDLAAAVCRAHGMTDGDHALAIVATSLDDLRSKLSAALSALESDEPELRDPRGVYYSSESLADAGKLAFVFPGQGSQRVNMLRDLANGYPGVREVFEAADRSLGEALNAPLSSLIFPHPKFDAESKASDDAALTQTNVAQPAMGAADLAMFKILGDLGVRADMACGHSYGEYVALHAAGAIDADDLLRISEARGRLIAEAAASNPGTMAAVDADGEVVAQAIDSLEGVSIANLNSPQQTVIAGTESGVDQAVALLSQRGVKSHRIRVSCAFHTKLVADAAEPFARALSEAKIQTPRIPVYSNTTALPHDNDPGAIRKQLVEHLVNPVRFRDEIVAMHDAGARIFVEVGPGRTLCGLIERTLAGRPFVTINMDQPGRHGLLQLVHALGQLACAGVGIDPRRLFDGRVERTLDLDRLVEETKPAKLSPVTWMVNGARAEPISGRRQNKSPARPVDPSSTPAVTPMVDATKSAPSNPDVAASPTRGARHAQVERASTPTQPVVAPEVSQPSASTLAHRPVDASTAVRTAANPDVESVMSAHQSLMTRFLETQKNVMLQYLQGSGTASQAGVLPPAAPASEDSAPSLPAAPTHEVEQPQQTVAREVEPPVAPASQPPAVAVPSESTRDASADAPAADTGLTREKLTTYLVGVVSERTGYPPEMLDLDLDLEADLGIDSIKRIEILGSLQSESMLPSDSADADMEVLAKLKTLRAIVDWIIEESGPAATTAAPSVPSAVEAAIPERDLGNDTRTADADQKIPRMVLETVERPIRLEDTQTSIDGVVLVVDDETGVGASLAQSLMDRGVAVEVVTSQGTGSSNGRRPRIDVADRAAVADLIADVRSERGSIGGVVYLLPLVEPAYMRSDDPSSWSQPLTTELHGLFNLVQAAEEDLRKSKGRVIVATALGGWLGSGGGEFPSGVWPGHGGVCGLTKTLAREWTDVTCRVVDFGSDASVSEKASAIEAELFTTDDLAEVGYHQGRRTILRPLVSQLDTSTTAGTIDASSILLITGGARGITAQVAIELAQRFSPTLLLVGRSALPPDTEASDTSGVADQKALKAILRSRIEQSEERATPAMVEAEYGKLCREREVRANLAEMRAAGSAVEYHAVDVGDATAFAALIDAIYETHGRIDGVIHGAGVTEDKLIRDKTLESFERVVRPKVVGAFTLASRLRSDSLQFVYFFSSVSARYGNRGQGDYAAANEVLNKPARWLNQRWKARVASLNWGPWESGGMVSAELAKQFAKAGIEMITRPAGRKAFVSELLFGHKADAEVLFGGPIGVGEDAPESPGMRFPHGLPLLNARAKSTLHDDGSIEVIRVLDPKSDLYLLDHQLDGKPVMPMAMGLELLAEIAASSSPDLQLTAIRDLRVLSGIQIDQGSQTLRITGTPSRQADGSIHLRLRVETGDDRPRVCYTAVAELTVTRRAAPRRDRVVLTDSKPLSMSVDEVYEKWLFHGPLFAGIVEVEAIGEDGIIATLSPSSPQRCLAEANGSQWLIDPVMIDSGLQLLIIWSRTHLDQTPLPSRFGCYHHICTAAPGDLRCEIQIHPGARGPTFHSDLMFYDANGALIGWIEDMEATCSKALNRLGETPDRSKEVKP